MKMESWKNTPDYGEATSEEKALVRSNLLKDPVNQKLSSEELETLVAEECRTLYQDRH